MSGHFATLRRSTVGAFLPGHEVYITDWQDTHNVPLAAGRFDLDDYIDTLIGIFRFFEGDVHVFAVCQPSVTSKSAHRMFAMPTSHRAQLVENSPLLRPPSRPIALRHRRRHLAPCAHADLSRHERHRSGSVTRPQSWQSVCSVTFLLRQCAPFERRGLAVALASEKHLVALVRWQSEANRDCQASRTRRRRKLFLALAS
jgi:hypothetical protein